jgi:acyl transferase domain-containing protein
MKKNVDAFAGSPEALASPDSTGTNREAVAVVGFALKFPQDVTSEERLWKLLMERQSTMTDVPSNRWNVDGFYKPYDHRPGTVRVHKRLSHAC